MAGERTSDRIHREQNRTERRRSWEHVVDLVVRICHPNRDLREVAGVRAREELFVMIQAHLRVGRFLQSDHHTFPRLTNASFLG